MNRSPQNAADGGGFGSRATLTDYPAAKTVYFYKDGDQNFNALKLAVHPRKYRSFNALLNELSSRIPMSFGVRSIYTPRGHDNVGRIDDLSNEGRYVCSTYTNHARGVDLNRLGQARTWHFTRPPSGQRALNTILSPRERDRRNRIRAKRRMEVQKYRPAEPSYNTNGIYPKKITVMKNGEPRQRHIVLLNRRTAQSFEQVLCDLSEMFQMAARKIYTMDGRQIQSLSSIFNGPEVFVVAGTENFRQMDGFSPQPPLVARPRPNGYRSRHFANSDRYVANRLRDRRERLGRTRGRWRVWLTTNELPSAGTDAGVSITVYGTRSNSGPIPLNNDDQELYQSGKIDQFDINVGNIGEVFKIRIGHDNVGEFPNWLCDEVKMRDMDTGEELRFPCKRWLARDEEDGEICRELPAARKGEPVLPIVKYELAVTTGELWNAGTNANVYLTMYGERGDTGVRQLTAERKDLLFLTGQTNTFHLEAVSLGPIRRVIVGHDTTEPGDGWYLEKIVVRDPSKNSNEFVFFCGKWLDSAEDDGKVVRELKAQDEYMTDILEKKYWEYEKWKFGNGSQVMLFSCQTGSALRIKPDATVDASAEVTDPAAIFHVTGKRGMIRVFGSAYHKNFHLAIDNGRLLGQGKGGPYCEFRVRVQADRTVLLESVKYPLQHINIAQNGRPADVRGMGTAAAKQFHVYCKGMFRDTGIIILMTSPTQALSVDHENEVMGTGKKSRVSQFRVHKVSEGVRMFESVVSPGQYLQLRQGKIDCKGETEVNSHFIVEKHKDTGYVSLQSFAVRGLYIGMAGDGSVRPTVSTGEKNIWLFPEVLQFGIPKARDETDDARSPSPAKVPPRTPTPPPTQRREASPVVVVQQTQESPRKATPPPPKAKPASPQKPVEKPQSANSNKSVYNEGDWKVAVSTQETAQNAEIALVVYGDKGQSGQIILGSPDQNLFQKGNLDELKVNLLSIGVIYKIRLELIPAHLEAEAFWKVKEVKLQDAHTKELLKFSFDRWLSLQQDDGEIMRELPALRPGKPELPVIKYRILVHTGIETGSDTDAHVYLTLFGERGDTGRRPLHRSNKDRIFQKGQVDEFWLEAVSLGRLKSCHVSHDGSGSGEGWFCRQVVVREGPDAAMETVFPCDQWLDSSMADKKIERMLTANEESPVVTSGQDPVEKEEEAQLGVDEDPVVTQEVEVEQPIGEDESIVAKEQDEIVEDEEEPKHEEEPRPEPEQKLEQPDTPDAENEADPEERPVPVEEDQTQIVEESYKAGDWKIWVTTGKDDTIKTTEDILMVAYGETGVSELVVLGNRGEGVFQPSTTDEFKVNLGGSLGNLYKIRIGHKDMEPSNGWQLEKVKMQDMTTSEVLSFRAGRWLSRGQDDLDTWRELPVVRPGKDPLPVIVYGVEVYTGTEPGADTDATVHITLHGTRGDSGQRILYHSQNNDTKFQSGQVDMFNIEAVSLDEVTKLVIGHNGKGAGAGWFLDKVIVRETKDNQTTEYYFPCNRWLDEGQDDKLIEREILAQPPPADSRGEYKLWISTDPDSKPANGGKVYLTAYGEKGRSKDVEVCASGGKAFEPGNTDEFEVAFGDIGDLYKIRMTREDNSAWEGWYLKEVKLSDKATGKEYLFTVHRWLSRSKDDFDVVRELPVLVENTPILPVCHYEVQVYTGNHWAAATESPAYITLHGQKGDSGKRQLFHSTNNPDNKFQQNQMDSFKVEAVSLEDLTHVVIGHHGTGHGSGWFVDRVVVREKEGQRSNVELIFPCGQWLDDHEADGKTERTLRPIDSLDTTQPKPVKDENKKTQGKWRVLVKTSDIHNAGTHAQAYLTFYGSKATSKPQTLGDGKPDSDFFNQGKETEFNVDIGDIGDLFKLRLEHDNKNDFPAWHVDYLKLSDGDTQEEITVYVDRWLALDEDDGQLCREFPIVTPTSMPLPVLHYIVVVYTGSQKEAGTDTTIYFNMFGDMGDIGHRTLMDSRTNAEPYQPGQVDVFVSEAVSVGKISKVELFHNGKNKGQSWFVDRVVVLENEAALTETVFQCSDWLEVKDGETMAMKQYTVTDTQPVSHSVRGHLEPTSNGRWTIWATTGTENEAGTKDEVNLIVYGTLGHTEPTLLNSGGEITAGSTTELKITVGVIGRVFKVGLLFGGKEKDSSWFLKKLKMKDDETGQEFHFDYNNWVRATLDNPRGVTELPAIRPDIPPLSETKYIVSVFTGSQHCADTEAGVFCNLIGQWGESGQRPLATPRKSSEPFKKGQVDEFAISSLDLGQLEKVVIGHSKSGRGQGWFCERVTVKTLTSPTEQIFVCNRWLDTGCDDRQLVRELLPLASVPIQGDADQDKRREKSKGVWSCLVTMATASKLSHHTIDVKQPVDVSLVVCGSVGVTESFELGKIRPLLIGNMEEYKGLKFGDVGKVEKIRVVLGKEMDLETIWVLEEIILEDEETKETLRFDFSLFVGKVFTECYKELPAVRPTEPVKPVIPYLVKVHTSSDKDASTDSSVFITLFGKEGDSGRRHLAVNQKGSTKFQLGQVDEFTVEAVDLGDLEKVLVTKGPGDPWHLNKVVVKGGNFAASEAVCNYNSWLGDSNRKKEEVSTEIAVSRSESSAVAIPRDQAPHVPVSKGSWKVQTTTAKDHKKVPGLGVVVVLCGYQGETDPCPLSTDKKDAFNPGKVDDFLLKVSQDVGDLFKVRFGFSERTKDKMWKIQKVDFLDENAGDHFSFEPNDRLIVDKTHDGWKELPIVWPAVPILPVVKYQVSVHIGDVHKIPPTMNMFIKMEGQRGTTGQRQLKKPVNRLQKDKVDVYEVEAVTLMDITKVTLAHDSKAAGSGFFLKKVVIKESAEAEKEFVFECEKWFDAGEDDKEIERVLLVGGGQAQVTPVTQPEQQEQVEEQQEAEPPAKSDDPPDCKVTVTTSSEDDSGTNAKVTLTVIGQSGDSGPLPLSKEAGKSPFVTGQTEQFDVIAKLADIGDIKKIRLEHDNSGNSPGWRVEKVVLENLKDSTKLEFGVNKHLSYDDDYGDVVVEVPVQGNQSSKKGPTAVKKYHVEVDTGESTGAGTDANVYITLYGEKGDSGKRNLKKSQEGGDMFEAGKIDTFIIEAVDLGKLSRVVIGHDSTGAGSSWKLDNVMVREGSDDDNKIIFHCGQWLDSEKGDGKTEREIFPLQEDDDDDDDV